MSIWARLTEAAPAARWYRSRVWAALVTRRAFGRLGHGSVIVAPRTLRGVDRMFIGDGCAIYEGAWLQCETSSSELHIGDGVYIGHDVHLHAVDAISIGPRCHLTDGVLLSSGGHPGQDRSEVVGTGPIVLGEGVFVGERAMILGGVTVGDGATIGAAAVVTHDVAAGATVAGIPAREVRSTPT